jgi:hypothetical protein
LLLGSILDNGAVYTLLFGLAVLVRWLVLRARPSGRAAE